MDFVIIANPWEQGENNPTSKHHIARELVAGGHQVLWTNGTGMRAPSITSRSDRKRALDKIGAAFRGTERIKDAAVRGEGALSVISPLVFPFPASRAARAINARIYLAAVRRAMRKLGFGSAVLVNFLPVLPEVIRGWDGCSVYYCVDRWDAFDMYDAPMMGRLDALCCGAADVVIASSRDLYDRCRARNENTHLVTHGVSYEHFRKALDLMQDAGCRMQDSENGSGRPGDLPKGRIIGFFGLVSEWVDQDLLVELADNLPECNVVLIGPADVDTRKLGAKPNIHLLGPRPFRDLPSYVAHFDAGIIPFVVNDLTKALNPIKLREMLAAGCPVVSTNLPEAESVAAEDQGQDDCERNDLDRHKRGVVVARNHDEFVAAVRGILEKDFPEDERREISDAMRSEDWAAKTEEIVTIAGRVAGGKVQRMGHRLRYVPYPPTSLPIRDLFVLDYVPFDRQTRLMEIGVGGGETFARLALECGEVTGVDIAQPVLDSLQYLKRRMKNLHFVCADVTADVRLGKEFDSIVSCDTLEHVSVPDRFFTFILEHLAPGATGHVLFPNEFPPTRHGVTSFTSRAELLDAIGDGFAAGDVYRVDLDRCASLVVAFCYGWMDRLLRHGDPRAARVRENVQRFDETRFFRRTKLWTRLSPAINFYWFVMLRLCRLCGSAYSIRPARDDDFDEDCNLYVRLRKDG